MLECKSFDIKHHISLRLDDLKKFIDKISQLEFQVVMIEEGLMNERDRYRSLYLAESTTNSTLKSELNKSEDLCKELKDKNWNLECELSMYSDDYNYLKDTLDKLLAPNTLDLVREKDREIERLDSLVEGHAETCLNLEHELMDTKKYLQDIITEYNALKSRVQDALIPKV